MKQTQSLTKELTQLKKLLTNGQAEAAISKAETLQSQHPSNLELMWVLAKLYQESNHLTQLQSQLELIHNQYPNEVQALVQLANLYYRLKDNKKALNYINLAEEVAPEDLQTLNHKSLILNEELQYSDVIDTLKKIIDLGKSTSYVWSNLGLAHQSLGLFDLAEGYYLKAIEMAGKKGDSPYNNLIVLNHYVPNPSPQKIFNLATRWEKKYASELKPVSLGDRTKLPNKKLRIGLVSDGFRTHPVGQMITQILELLPKHEIELFAYSTSLKEDPITNRIKHCLAQWITVDHLNEQQLAEKLAKDQLDILFDLSGHMSGCRMRTMAMKPAPILVKWVGGLINTTGLSTMDYLLSDAIETPDGVDDWYTEKLIRMPHDYVCYEAPAYSHDVYSPPVTHNGYITLGCFNNPQKINAVVLEQWASIMHQLPNSRLFLKSFQFNSSILVDNVTNTMAEFGITAERLIIEGPSSHSELLKAYNKVDIALDPWPYSGGLTTCEAMFMGVPVVTLPGPTFAGRHSATHLTNAGLGQLVVDNWDDYRSLVIDLANDVDNLANIRQHLRSALLESPVCDAPSFARHFSNAMRAIWQRHCEGRPTAALTLNAEGECQFADQSAPIQLQIPVEAEQDSAASDDEQSFSFNFTGLITALDHGASLASRPYFRDFLKKGGVNYICLDPGGVIRNAQQLQHTELFHHFPLMVLGDGSNIELRLAVEAELSSTLPLAPDSDSSTQPALVSTTAVTSNRIDDIKGIDSIDWLILDLQHNNRSILEHGQKKLANALLIEVFVSFLPEHVEHISLTAIQTVLAEAGLEPLAINKTQDDANVGQAIFIPNQKKLEQLNSNQLMKLAFLLDTVYNEKEVAHKLISKVDKKQALLYFEENLKSQSDLLDNKKTKKIKEITSKNNTIVHIGFNNMHLQNLVNILSEEENKNDFEHFFFISRSRSIPNWDIDLSKNKNALFFNSETQLDNVLAICLSEHVNKIIFHGLFFPWQNTLLGKIGHKNKVAWIIWGGDLYNNLKIKNENIKHVDIIGTVAEKDYDVFSNIYGQRAHHPFYYFGPNNYINIQQPTKKEKTIIVGNSGDPSNNHIEILLELYKKKDIKDYKIIIPISYNANADHVNMIKSTVKKLNLSDTTEIMEGFIPPVEYFSIIAKCEVFVTAHNRPQAGGNLQASIFFGNKTILKKKISVEHKTITNPMWTKIEKMDLSAIDYADFENIDRISNLKEKNQYTLKDKKEKIVRTAGHDNALYNMEVFFNL
ncbi:TDP-N-acetylfucosamine:lipid II N-acetylfucosaminyltransferase [Oceanisphaera sp. W20_SRM_FM3]|uniref:TDP-N-acetylfucosamine:lipid II N-acetylfucosaminyltransferase n=1 Tax=Oceanisphaera sp. W20_SRM_FM3 TaxID=3240267 RepID=UPI003F9B4290